jgi:hypothetical protein
VELVPLDEVLAGGDYLDEEERAALHGELEASIAEAEAGKLIDADEVLDAIGAPTRVTAPCPSASHSASVMLGRPCRAKQLRMQWNGARPPGSDLHHRSPSPKKT